MMAASVSLVVVFLSGCSLESLLESQVVNPFLDVLPIELLGRTTNLTNTIVPLGSLEADQVLKIDVIGEDIDAVFILTTDDLLDAAGVIAGGGHANKTIEYRVPRTGRYFVFVLFDPRLDESQRRGTISVGPGTSTFLPPPSQPVLIEFKLDFLTGRDLDEPSLFTNHQLDILEAISGTVRKGIIARLESIFSETPIEILTEAPLDGVQYSTVTFVPDRVLNEGSLVRNLLDVDSTALEPLIRDLLALELPDTDFSTLGLDALKEFADNLFMQDSIALPSFRLDSLVLNSGEQDDSMENECKEEVIFGLAPRDYGNQDLTDKAFVFVGSFQGGGLECRTAVLDSVNNIILALSHTAAHEIGHLVGLCHVPVTDIMFRVPNLSFQRELAFGRGQLEVVDVADNGRLSVRTGVIQDPAFYFRAIFLERK